MPCKLSTCFFLFSLFVANTISTSLALASLVVPDDQNYESLRFSRTKLVIAEDYKSHASLIIPYTDYFLNLYEKSFGWKLDETTAFVIASPRNQIPNGITFNTPNLEMVFYPTGAEIMDQFAVKSWLHVLLTHESAHLYQLNAKERTSSRLTRVFGNAVMPFFPIPIFLQPNVFLPTFVLEGNAVLNESRFGLGGRLFSGEVRAQVYALLREKKTDMRRLMNDHLYFPFGSEKYLVGGYFMAYLAERFGVERVNSFFKTNAIHWINPFLLNKSFKSTFGIGYQALWDGFVAAKQAEFTQQVSSPQTPLFGFFFFGNMNHDKDSVYFVAQTNGRQRPVLVRINKQTLSAQFEERQLSLGKLFYLNDIPTTVSSELNSVRRIQYSLYGEGRKLYREFNSKIVQDRRGGHTLSFNAENSLIENHLEYDGRFLDTAHSSAILDDQGHAYYFRQDKLDRVLIRDRKEIARFKGFYGKPLEVLADGEVVFIGATPTGSSLFGAKDGHIRRLSTSDTIVDARSLNGQKFFVIEVSGSQYEAKIIDRIESPQNPTYYQYSFNKSHEFETLQGPSDRVSVPTPSNAVERSTSYFEPWHLRYSSTLFSSFIGPSGFFALINMEFNDPLQYNNVTGTYMMGWKHRQSAQLAYTNTRHIVNYSLGALYDEDLLISGTQNKYEVLDRHFNHTAYLDLLAPLFVWRRWTGGLLFETSYEHIAGTQGDTIFYPGQRNLGFFTDLKFNFLEKYEVSFAPYRTFGLTLAHKLVGNADHWKAASNVYAGQIQASQDLGLENIVSANGGVAFSTEHNIQIDDTFALHPTPFTFSTLIPGLANVVPGFATRALAAQQATLAYQKVFNRGFYFKKFPLSLRRFAPFLKSQYFWYRERVSIPFPSPRDQKFWLYSVGVDFETLLVHKAPVRISLAYVGDTLSRTADGLLMGLSTELHW